MVYTDEAHVTAGPGGARTRLAAWILDTQPDPATRAASHLIKRAFDPLHPLRRAVDTGWSRGKPTACGTESATGVRCGFPVMRMFGQVHSVGRGAVGSHGAATDPVLLLPTDRRG